MLFRDKTKIMLQDALLKDAAANQFRRLWRATYDETDGMVAIQTSVGGRESTALRIPLSEFRKVTNAAERTLDTSSNKAFVCYHYLKDRGLLKVWFDKARSLGLNTPHYA